ncbi:hypothetical protein BGX31_004871, partial [Mortierella sp. GBA43]
MATIPSKSSSDVSSADAGVSIAVGASSLAVGTCTSVGAFSDLVEIRSAPARTFSASPDGFAGTSSAGPDALAGTSSAGPDAPTSTFSAGPDVLTSTSSAGPGALASTLDLDDPIHLDTFNGLDNEEKTLVRVAKLFSIEDMKTLKSFFNKLKETATASGDISGDEMLEEATGSSIQDKEARRYFSSLK